VAVHGGIDLLKEGEASKCRDKTTVTVGADPYTFVADVREQDALTQSLSLNLSHAYLAPEQLTPERPSSCMHRLHLPRRPNQQLHQPRHR
jgi:hypothetical protein